MMTRKMLAAGALVALGVFAPVLSASADDYVNHSTPSSVEGTVVTRGSVRNDPKPTVLAATRTRGLAGLPVTGGDIAELTVIGLASLATGTVLVRRSHRTSGQPA
jgi:hypothetical protein